MGHLNSFSAWRVGDLSKNFPKIQMPGRFPGGMFKLRFDWYINLTIKFTIVAEIVSLLKKIYKRDGPLRAVFKVKNLAVLFPPYPREMKTNTAKFKSAAILALACFYGNGANHSHARSIVRLA